MNRKQISILILKRLQKEMLSLQMQFEKTKVEIGYFYIDDLLPSDLAIEIFNNFPESSETVLKKSLKEYKHIAVQMNNYNSLLEEVVYAFQEPEIVELVEEICCIKGLQPDSRLYAGGLSMMSEGHFLNPHLDNSHDKEREKWRVLNLLYYVTPDWELANGGNLELWPEGPQKENVTVVSKFNRLAVMATHDNSWHSVSKVSVSRTRCCISNYYFSKTPWYDQDKFHVTTFRGRPEEKIRDKWLRVDAFLRNNLRKVFKKGVVENPHVYRKEKK